MAVQYADELVAAGQVAAVVVIHDVVVGDRAVQLGQRGATE
jgi:hypothetical protein